MVEHLIEFDIPDLASENAQQSSVLFQFVDIPAPENLPIVRQIFGTVTLRGKNTLKNVAVRINPQQIAGFDAPRLSEPWLIFVADPLSFVDLHATPPFRGSATARPLRSAAVGLTHACASKVLR